MFPPELESSAFRSGNGEYGWTREQIPIVANLLGAKGLGILGGELWWIPEGHRDWRGSIPQRNGPPAVYHWETEYRAGETWAAFVIKGVSDTLAAVQRWPELGDLPTDLIGRVLYNLTWTSQDRFEQLYGR